MALLPPGSIGSKIDHSRMRVARPLSDVAPEDVNLLAKLQFQGVLVVLPELTRVSQRT